MAILAVGKIMLQSLSLQNFALIESLQIDFDQGFNVITGETGAGKSLLLAAIGLCLGGRGDVSWVRHGTKCADILASFDVDNQAVRAWFLAHERPFALPIVIRRKIGMQGRSQAWINGSPASLSQLKSLGALLVTMHSQHASLELLRPQLVIDWLDDVGQLTALVKTVKTAFENYQTLATQRQAALAQMDARTDRIDLLSARLAEIEPLFGVDMARIEARFDELSNLESLVYDASVVCGLLDGDENDVAILGLLGRCQRVCQNHSEISQTFADSLDNIATSYELLKDSLQALRYYADNQSMDEEEYQALSQLMNLANRLANKYRLSIDELLTQANMWQNELDELQALADLDGLEQAVDRAFDEYVCVAKQLHDERSKIAPMICQQLIDGLAKLALPHASCEFVFYPKDQKDANAVGLYDIELLFSANVGMPKQPLHKVASGGELSRIALVMQVMRAGHTKTPLLVFDEVDIGMSGATAQVVGQLLRQLGEHCQLVAITHQAQVAAAAHGHILVKKQHGDHSQSQFERIDGQARIYELARMSGGITITDETLAHAKSLLDFVG